jgi:hypothetical protein
MEIPNLIFGLILIYLLFVTMLVIGSISKYKILSKLNFSSRFTLIKDNKSIEEVIRLIDNLLVGIGIGIFTGAIVVVYYNWVSCAFISECKPLETPNYFNIYYPLMLQVVVGTILLCLFLIGIRSVLIRRKT